MILGVVCPVSGEEVKTEDCLRCSLGQPDCNFDTMVLADMLWNRPQHGFTISEITSDFLRKTLLYHFSDYYVAPKNGYYAVRGKWAHTSKQAVVLPKDLAHTIREKRFSLLSIDSKISGQVDVYYTDQHRLVDYKTVSRMIDSPRPGHIRQLNAYAELLRANDYEVDEARITYLSYSSHKTIPIQVWERERTQNMLRELIGFYERSVAEGVVPPRDMCAGPDRWWICKYCPFSEACREHKGWWEVGGFNNKKRETTPLGGE